MSDIETVLSNLGIRIEGTRRSNKNGAIEYKALCPHHHAEYDDKGKFLGTREDHNPDWWINTETGQHICFSCGFSGSVEWLIHKVTGKPLGEIDAVVDRAYNALERIKKIDPWAGERPIELPPMNEARIKMYDTQIPEWALEKRRLTQEACEHYGIRWAPTFAHRDTVYEHCWITAIRDPNTSKVIGMQVKQEGGDKFFRNLPASVHKSGTLFGVEHLDGGTAVVMESPLDSPYVWTLKIPDHTPVSSYGYAVSDEQMELLIARCDRIVFALDNDDSGWKGVRRVLGLNPATGRRDRRLQDYSKRIPIYVANYDEALGQKDPGEMPRAIARAVICEAYSAIRLQMRITA